MGGDGNSMATTKKEVLPAGGGPSEDGKKIMAVVRVCICKLESLGVRVGVGCGMWRAGVRVRGARRAPLLLYLC